MKVVILGAGQGKRLLPLTAEVPKALLDIGGRTLIARQIDAFAEAGFSDFTVVTGYGAARMEDALGKIAKERQVRINTVFNPFYSVADNLASCWMARAEMDRDFIILNGDTVIEPECVKRLLASPDAPITVTVDVKENGYDADDMKVHRKGTRLLEIGKHLPPERSNAESIGMLYFRGHGPKLFTDTLEAMMHTPEGLKWWYLKVIGQIAERHQVETCSIEGLRWGEVDFPADFERVSALVETF